MRSFTEPALSKQRCFALLSMTGNEGFRMTSFENQISENAF
jgi:hypothetical protein